MGDSLWLEAKAKVKFTCSGTTGIYTVTAKGVSVAGTSARLDQADTFNLSGVYFDFHVTVGQSQLDIPMTQDAKTGLFDATHAGVLAQVGDCSTGRQVTVTQNDAFDNLLWDVGASLT